MNALQQQPVDDAARSMWGALQVCVAAGLVYGIFTRVGLRPNPHSNWAFLWVCGLILCTVVIVLAHVWLLIRLSWAVSEPGSFGSRRWRLTAALVVTFDIALGPSLLEWILK